MDKIQTGPTRHQKIHYKEIILVLLQLLFGNVDIFSRIYGVSFPAENHLNAFADDRFVVNY